MSEERGKLGGSGSMLLSGYGPLLVLIAIFALITTLTPTVAPERIESVQSGGRDPGSVALGGPEKGPGGGSSVVPGQPASGGQAVDQCADRDKQVPGDGYSPPCISFSGDNGGKTSRGVTDKEVVIAYRLTTDPSLQDALASVGGGDALDSSEAIERTAFGLVEYFNARFQLYGRKIKLVPFQGRGALTTELLGGGQDAANNDAIKVSKELAPFADISALSQPYSDALARQKVMAFNAPYMSREWYTARRPYTWSLTPDCTLLTGLIADYANKRIFGRPAAYAGGDLQGQARRIAVISPDNPEYQQCVDSGVDIVRSEGNSYAMRESYTLDIASLSSQAASLVAKMRSQDITSVACVCDPILPIFMTAKAHEQTWFPEWFVTGTALTDVDVLGQLYDQEEWSHAFGISALGELEPLRGSFAYQAYKSIRKDEPALIVDILYYTIYMLALGIHMAGPNLTPETFEKGMFAYPGGQGIAGRWKFGPGDYTPMEDAREIWWDPEARSVQNGEPGAYRGDKRRYKVGEWTREAPNVFK
ncbi:MAG: hypothetical protein WD646_14435 [Actinomycetota bacterium]